MIVKRVLQVLLLILPAVALNACDPNYTYMRGTITPNYSINTFNYAAGGRDLAVVAIGNPYAGQGFDNQDLPESIAAAMQGKNWGQPTNFTATPGETARPNYKVVFAFNPVEPANYRQICDGDVRTGPTEGRIRVKAAFCQGGQQGGHRFLTTVRGSIVPEAGPGSESFNKLFAGMTLDLFPPIYLRDRDKCRSFFIVCP